MKNKKKAIKESNTQKEQRFSMIWESIKRSERKEPKQPVSIDTAIRHLKEVLEDEKNNR